MINVQTKEQLMQAIKNKEPNILITNKELALKVRKAKTIRKWLKRTLISLLAIFGLGAGAIALLPVTVVSAIITGITGGVVSTGVVTPTGAGVVSTGVVTPTGAGVIATGTATGTANAVAGGSCLGVLLLSFWKDYQMTEFNIDTGFLKLTIKPRK